MIHPNSAASNILRKILGRRAQNELFIHIYRYYIKCYSKFFTWAYFGRKYEASIDPFNLTYIDPGKVKKKQSNKSCFVFSDVVSEVHSGEWDEEYRNIAEIQSYKSFQRRFNEKVPWEETRWYKMRSEEIQNGVEKWGCQSIEDFHRRLEQIDDLYNRMKKNGYMTQRQLSRPEIDDPIKRDIHEFWPAELNEVVVNIDRSGEIILHDGRHRMFIAKVLNIGKIPVRVKTRHKKWQEARDKCLHNKQFPIIKSEHPDLPN